MVRLLLRRRVVIADGGFSKRGERTGENDHRAIYHRTLSGSEPVGSGEDKGGRRQSGHVWLPGYSRPYAVPRSRVAIEQMILEE